MQNYNVFQVEDGMNFIMLQNIGPLHQHLLFTADAFALYEDALSAADTNDDYADMPDLEDFEFDID